MLRLLVDEAVDLALDEHLGVIQFGGREEQVHDLLAVAHVGHGLDLRLHALAHARLQLFEVVDAFLVERARELVVELRQDLLLHFEQLDAVRGALAGEFLGRVVLGQVERELVRAAALEADQQVEEAGQGDDAALGDGELGALLDVRLGLPLDGHGHVDAHGVVPLHRAIDRLEGGVAPPQVRQRLVGLRLAGGHLVARHAQRLVGADLDRRADGHRRLDDQRLGRLELDLGLADRVDRLALEGFVVDGREQVLDRLLEQHRLPDGALDDRAGGLAGPEAGDADLL